MTGIPSQVTFNIPDLFKEAFGIYARFPVYFLGKADPNRNPDKIEQEAWDLGLSKPHVNSSLDGNPNMVSPSGVVLWDRFAFKHPDIANAEEPLFYMPIATTVEVSDDKNIVLTELIGNKGGTVKEMMSDGDHVVVFRGLIINFENTATMPMNELESLNKMYDLKASLPVVSKFLNNGNNINNLVFFKRQITGMEGYANVIKFELTALSDTPIELELSNQ